MKTMKLT